MWSLFRLLNELLSAIRDNSIATRLNTTALVAVDRRIAELLERLRNLPNPEPVSLLVTSENGTMLTFTITLPALPPEPNDIASGELTITVGAGEPQTIATTKEQTEVVGLSGEQGDNVIATFAYIDDAGNKSVQPSTVEVVLADTIPPANPGELGLTVTGETT